MTRNSEQPPRTIAASHIATELDDAIRRQRYGPSTNDAPPIETQRRIRQIITDHHARERMRAGRRKE